MSIQSSVLTFTKVTGYGSSVDLKLRAAVAGTGLAGSSHVRAIRLVGAELVGVAASTPERGKAAAERFGARRHFDTAEEMAEAPDIDVIHVCLPNAQHAPVTIKALKAGKHVVCEKPLTTDGPSADDVLNTWQGTGMIGTVPFVYRYYPMVRELRARLAAGDAGRLHLIHGSYLQDWLASAERTNWRVDPTAGGTSRAFADIGSHWCDLAEFVTGQRIHRLSARMSTAFAERPESDGSSPTFSTAQDGIQVTVANEDLVVMHFETADGVLGSAVISHVSPGRKNALSIEVSGTSASASFAQEHPSTIWIGRQGRSTTLVAEPSLLSPDAARHAVVPAGHPQGWLDCIDRFVADTYLAIAGEKPEGLPTIADGHRAVTITEAVLQSSAAAGQWVDVPEVAP